jgi:DNA-binding protein H-NS
VLKLIDFNRRNNDLFGWSRTSKKLRGSTMRTFRRSIHRFVKSLLWTIAVLYTVSSTARAQNTDDVRQQLQDLKQQYEQTTLEFQKRINDLEEKINKQSRLTQEQQGAPKAPPVATAAAPPSAPASLPAATTTPATPPITSAATTTQAPAPSTGLAAQTAREIFKGESEQVGQKYQGDLPSEPTYDLLNEADVKIANLTK